MKFSNKISLEHEQRNILFSSFAAISGVGLLSYAALPFLMGSTMESLGLSESNTGLLYSLEFITAAISSLILAPRTGRIKRKNIALVGASIVVLGNLVSALWCSFEFLLIVRPLIGIGAGLALACGNATISNAKNPARIAGMMNVMFAGMLLLLMLFLPQLSVPWGVQGVFLGLAGVTLIFLVMLLQMPQHAKTNDLGISSTKTNRKVIFSTAGIAIFIVFLLFTLRDSMVWGFAARIGIEVGYTTAEVGGILSLQAFIGLLGPIIATIIGFKYGVKRPLLLGLIFAGLTTYAVILSVEVPYLFEGAVLFWTAGYFFAISYMTAYAATLDPDGRVVAATGSALVLGVAIGPALSGFLINYGGYAFCAWINLLLVFAMIIAAMVSLKSTVKKRDLDYQN
jgi:predicted MFS family arabinose efflux permease